MAKSDQKEDVDLGFLENFALSGAGKCSIVVVQGQKHQ